MARKATCPICKQPVEPKDNHKLYHNKKYHITCYKQLVQEKYKQSTSQQDDKQELYEYICQLYEIKELTPLIKAQTEKYYTDNEFTYTGMFYTLKYFYETLENDVNNSNGIGIIPYVYQEAKEFYILKNNLLEKEYDLKNCVIPVSVKFKPKQIDSPYLIRMEEL